MMLEIVSPADLKRARVARSNTPTPVASGSARASRAGPSRRHRGASRHLSQQRQSHELQPRRADRSRIDGAAVTVPRHQRVASAVDAAERPLTPEIHRLVGSLAATLLSLTAAGAAHASSRWTKLDETPGFSSYRAELQRMVDAEGRTPINHFCVVAESFGPPRGIEDPKPPPKEVVARVYWREKHQLRTWDQGTGTTSDFSVRAGNLLDLRKDVVATQTEIGMSTYLVTRSWVRDILDHCARSGTSLEVMRR